MKLLLSLIFFLALNLSAHPSAFAQGGSMGGGGGWGAICTDPKTKEITAMPIDRYRFEKRRTHPLAVQLGTGSVQDMVNVMLARLAEFSPLRAELYRQYIADMPNEIEFRTDGKELLGVQDPNLEVDFEFEEGCEPKPVVVQLDRLTENKKRYLVTEKYWKKFDSASIAIMYFHEASLREVMEERLALGKIYDQAASPGRISIDFPRIQTRDIRNLNGEIFTNHFQAMNYLEKQTLIANLPYSRGIEIPQEGPGFVPMIATKVQITAEEQLMDSTAIKAAYRLKFELPILTFRPDGQPQTIYLSRIPPHGILGIDFPKFQSDLGVFPNQSLGAVIEFKENKNQIGIYPLMAARLPSSDLFYDGTRYMVRNGTYWVIANADRSFTLTGNGTVIDWRDPNMLLANILTLADFAKLPLFTIERR